MHKTNKSHFLLDMSGKNGCALADDLMAFYEFKLFSLRVSMFYTFSSEYEKDQEIQVQRK